MMKPVTNNFLTASALVLAFVFSGASLPAYANHSLEDEDTILVEKRPNEKIPYSKIVRKLSKKLFGFDPRTVTHFGKGRKQGVAKSFSDYMDRSKYRVKVRGDKVVLKYTVFF